MRDILTLFFQYFGSFVSLGREDVVKIAIRRLLQDDWIIYKLQLVRELYSRMTQDFEEAFRKIIEKNPSLLFYFNLKAIKQ
jgi:hypothetical protein